MNKSCQECQTNFTVSDEEIKFLNKIHPTFNGKKYEIPTPEICPDCRLATRTAHRNEQFMYHNKSAVTGKDLISLYSPDTDYGKNYKIYTHEEWWSDNWDGLDYGQDFDFSRPFFDQFYELSQKIPHVNLIQLDNENSPFTTGTGYCKNCYLINCSENDEDCYYGKLLQGCKDCMDCTYAYDSELCYQCFYIHKCYNCKYLYYSQNCFDSYFSENLKGCKNCFLCTNLSNKEFCFMNQQLTKDQYEAKVKAVFSSPKNLEKAKNILLDMRKKRIYKYANIVNSENSNGDFLTNCKNCHECYDVNDSEDCKYVTVGVEIKDVYDCSNMYVKPELCYQTLGTIGTYNVHFSLFVFNSQDVLYSEFCFNSKNLFGCSGLRKKEYCIFNKQYTKEQYEKLVPQIIEHMQKTGEFGKYFPIKNSPFGYNETVANEYLPLTKDQALAKGYHWKDANKKDYKEQSYKIPENIKDVKDDILDAVLACKKCAKNYKIIPQELKRLRNMKMNIPIFCPDCRQMERMTLRNARKIYNNKCAKCATKIQSTFAPNQPETIYCENCYVTEVY